MYPSREPIFCLAMPTVPRATLKHGDGHVFADAKIINKNVCVYLQALEIYVRKNLKGVLGEQYAKPQGRICLR